MSRTTDSHAANLEAELRATKKKLATAEEHTEALVGTGEKLLELRATGHSLREELEAYEALNVAVAEAKGEEPSPVTEH